MLSLQACLRSYRQARSNPLTDERCSVEDRPWTVQPLRAQGQTLRCSRRSLARPPRWLRRHSEKQCQNTLVPPMKTHATLHEEAPECAFLVPFDESAPPPLLERRVPTQEELTAEWAPKLAQEQLLYRKFERVHAKVCHIDGATESVVNGESKEITFHRGDYIIMDPKEIGGKYVIPSSEFATRYDRYHPEPARSQELSQDGFFQYRPKGLISVHKLTEDDVLEHFPANTFVSSWGKQEVKRDDFVAIAFPEGKEVYITTGDHIDRAYKKVTVVTSEAAKKRHRRQSSVSITAKQLTMLQTTGVVPDIPLPGEHAITWPRYLVHPHRAPRLAWDCLTVLLISYSIIAIPFVLAFDPPSARPERQGAMLMISRGIDCIFMMDVVLNMFTAVDDTKTQSIITDLWEIRRRYFCGWFLVDVLSAFPLDMVVNEDAGERVRAIQMTKSLKIFRLLRVVRIFRILRIQRILSRLERTFIISHHVRSLVVDGAIVLLVAHWCTCAFYGAGSANCSAHGEADEECNYSSWIKAAGYEGSPLGRKYIATLYWTMMTLTTVGFGDIAAQSGVEQVVAIIVMITGAAATAFGVSHVVQMTNEMSADARDFRLKVSGVTFFSNVSTP